jgi:uncharacterized protein
MEKCSSCVSITAKSAAKSNSQPGTLNNRPLNVTTFGVTTNFEWDEAKNRANMRKHAFDFADAEEMFRGVLVVDPRHARGLRAHVVFAERDLETIRIISLIEATSREQKEYEKAIPDRLEAN